MALPTKLKTPRWAEKQLGIADDELKKLTRSDGYVEVALLGPLIQDVLFDLSVLKAAVGLPQLDLQKSGDEIVNLVKWMISDLPKPGKDDDQRVRLDRICDLLSIATPFDFTILQDFWALRYTPQQISRALYRRAKSIKYIPKRMPLALNVLSELNRRSSAELPISR